MPATKLDPCQVENALVGSPKPVFLWLTAARNAALAYMRVVTRKLRKPVPLAAPDKKGAASQTVGNMTISPGHYSVSSTGIASCHFRLSRALASVSNGPSVHSLTISPEFVVLAST